MNCWRWGRGGRGLQVGGAVEEEAQVEQVGGDAEQAEEGQQLGDGGVHLEGVGGPRGRRYSGEVRSLKPAGTFRLG